MSFYSPEGLRAHDERKASPQQESLLASIPPDAPYDEPEALIHVWTGKKWIPYERWLATSPIAIEEQK
jgi:hypothetical protein